MANETRTMLVVLVVCGFLMLGCIGIPVGVGAFMFLRLSQEAQMAQAEAVRAVAAERQARDQAAMARLQAESVAVTPPAAPNFNSPLAIPPGLTVFDVTDVEQRKTVFRTLKTAREFAQQLEQGLAQLAVGADEANLKQAIAEMKKAENEQLEQVCKAYGITRKQLDEIVVEGDKAGW